MREYTEQEHTEALALLIANGGRVKRTSRELGIPHPTLISWRDAAIAADESLRATFARDPDLPSDRVKTDHVRIFANAVELGGRILTENLRRYHDRELTPQGLRDVMVATGIARDVWLDVRDGRKSMALNVDARSVNLTQLSDEQLERLAAGQAALPAPASEEHTG